LECSAARLLFDRYFEKQLNPVQRKAIEDHLSGCGDCSLELKRIRRVFDLVDQYFRATKPSGGFVDDVLVGVEEASEHRRRRVSKPRPVAGEAPARGKTFRVVGIVGIVLVAAVALIAFLMRGGSRAGELVEVNRSAQRKSASGTEWTEVVGGERLLAGDTVRADGGAVRIFLDDRTEVVLSSGASFTVSRSPGSIPVRHRLEGEAASFRVIDGEGRFELEIPPGELRVTASTDHLARFSADREGEGDAEAWTVEVLRGTVDARTAVGSVSVTEGLRSTLRAGAAPSRPVPIREVKPTPDRTRRPVREEPPVRRTPTETSETPPPEEPKPVSIQELMARVRDFQQSDTARAQALGELASRVPPERTDEIRLLVLDLLRTDLSETVRDAAFSTLVGLGRTDLYDDAQGVFETDASLALRRKALDVLVKAKEMEGATHEYLLGALRALYPPELLPLKIDLVREIAARPAPEDLGPLLDGFHSSPEDDPVRPKILEALGSYKYVQTVDSLFDFLRDPRRENREAAFGALRKLTGQTFGYDASADEDPVILDEVIARWEAWWNENRDTFEF